jgi:predicted MFS family arabinose efflux permease
MDQSVEDSSDRPISLWRNRDYVLLWSGQLVSTLGTGISGIAYPLLILALTGSPAKAGIGGFIFGLPYVIFSLPAGALVDRWDRKRVMIICDSIRALNIGTIPIAAAIGHLTLAQLYGTAAVEGAAFTFFNIAEVACLPRVVSKEQLPQATGVNQAGFIASSLISSPLGGLIYQTLGRTVPFLIDAVSYAASVISLRFIRVQFQRDRTVDARSLRVEIAEGMRWLWHQPLIRYMSFLTGGLNFAFATTFLSIIVLAKQQGASPAIIGILFGIESVGGLLGSVSGPWIQRRFRYAHVIIGTVWFQALLWPLLAVAPSTVALGVVLAGISLVAPIYNVVQFSYRVSLIPDELQGRVNSTVRLIAFGFNPLGLVLSGVLIEAFGAVTAVLCVAGIMVFLAISVGLNGHVRHAPRIPSTLPA